MRLSKVGLTKTFIEQIWDLQLGPHGSTLKYCWKETIHSLASFSRRGSSKVANGGMYLSVH
jgi:hypothetical protein